MNVKKIFCLFLVVIFALVSSGSVSAQQQDEETDVCLQFGEDGKFVLLHITDIQDRYPLNNVTKQYICDILDEVQPDLVVLGGDNIAGNSILFKCNVTKAINEYMSIFEEKGVMVASVYGNHDAENKYSTKQYQQSVYESYSCYVGTTGYTDGDRVGNYNLPILSSDGSHYAFNLWFIDSGEYNEDNDLGGYAAVTECQIEWYKTRALQLKEQNGGKVVPSINFQHIIVPEIFSALAEVEKDTEGAVEKTYTQSDETKYYILPENAVGEMNEIPCPPDFTYGQFDAMLSVGDVLATVSGHDHTNGFEVEYKGIDIINTPGIGLSTTTYNGDNAGARVFVLDENNPEEYETYLIGFDDIYSEEDVLMQNGIDAYLQTNSIFKRIYHWFLYQFNRIFG